MIDAAKQVADNSLPVSTPTLSCTLFMMIPLHKSLKIAVLLSISCLLSSCNYRALSQENKDLKERKAQLSEDVDNLIVNMDDDPEGEPASVKITKAEAHLIRLQHERRELLESVQALKERRAQLEAEYAKRKKEYGSKS